MDVEDIESWDLIRHKLREAPFREAFIKFANICSKHFMDKEPERWYRFCDGKNTETDLHQRWVDIFSKNENIAIECAREHLKTSFVLNLMLFTIWRNDNMEVLYISSKQGQAKDKIAELETIYNRNSHWLDLDKSDDQWTKKHKKWDNGSSIRGEGWGTAIEGAHVQLIVLDDILRERGGMTDAETWNFLQKVVSPMVTESGKKVLVGTKKRKHDIFDRVEKNPGWEHRRYPATPDNPIFPEKWSEERLKKKKREMVPVNFRREYGLEVVIGDEVLMSPEWNKRNRDSDLTYQNEYQGGQLRVLGLDPAISPTGDYCAFFGQVKMNSGYKRVLHASREKGISLGAMKNKLELLDNRYNFSTIVIEQNSFQRLAVEDIIDSTSLPVTGHTTSKTKSDPSDGIPRIAIGFENGKYIYPYNTQEDKEKTDMVHEALNSLKYDGNKLTNNHTPDIVMAKYLSEQGLNRFESKKKSTPEPVVMGFES